MTDPGGITGVGEPAVGEGETTGGTRADRRRSRHRRSSRFMIALLVITGVALAWRITYAVGFKWDQLVTGDAYFYHHQANGLVDGFGFYRFLPPSVQHLVPNGPAADHPPLYSLYLAAFSLFGGRSFHIHMLASCLLGAATVFVCGLLGREVAGERAGIVAAIIATVYANLWIQDPLVTSESITMLMVALAVLFAYRLWRAPSIRAAVWFGIVCGLASLTRAEVILFLPLVLIPLVLSKRVWPEGLRLRVFVVSGVVAVLVMAPWLIRNLVAFDHPILVSGGGDITLASANCDATYYGDGLGWWSPLCYGKDAHPTGDASDQARYWRKRAFNYIDDHLGRLPVVLLARLGRAFDVYHPGSPFGALKSGQTLVFELFEGRDANGSSWAARTALGQYFVLAPLAIVGAFVLRRRRVTLVPLLAPVVVVCVAVLVAFGNTRYRTPAEITITVLSAVAIDAAISRWWRRGHGSQGEPEPAAIAGAAEPVSVGEVSNTSMTTPREPVAEVRPRRVFFPCFDGYRALAASAVLLLHVGVASGFVFRNTGIGRYVFRLDVGVAVFFLISGFLLYRPFAVAHLAGGDDSGPRTRDYFRGRFLRIFPAYWVALTAVLLFQHGPTHRIHNLGDFIAYYGLLQQYSVAHHFGGIQQAWTLCVEVSFYVFLPVWAFAIRALGRRSTNRLAVELAGLVVLYVTGLVWRGLFAHLDPSHTNLGLHVLPAFFDEFALGMGLAVLSVWFLQQGRTWRPFELAGRYPWACWLLASVCFWAASTQLDIPANYGILTARQWIAWTVSYGLTVFFLLLPGIFGPQDRGVVRGFLTNPVVRYVGLVSYGVYLWHEFWIDKYFDWTGNPRFALTGSTLVGFLVFVGGLSLVSATVSYYVIERPALRLRRGGLREYRQASAVGDARAKA